MPAANELDSGSLLPSGGQMKNYKRVRFEPQDAVLRRRTLHEANAAWAAQLSPANLG